MQEITKDAERVNSISARFIIDFFGSRSKAPVCIASYANADAEKKHFPPRITYTRDPAAVDRFVAKNDVPGRGVYYGVNTVKEGKDRRKENTAEITALHADLDFKDLAEGRDEIEAALERLPLPPTFVIFSGHGLHLLWCLRKAMPATPELIERVEHALKRIAEILAADAGTAEVARVLRMPGSHNTKFGGNIACIVNKRRDVDYSLAQLEDWLAGAEPLLHHRPKKVASPSIAPERLAELNVLAEYARFATEFGGHEPLDIEQMLDNLEWHGSGGGGNVHNTMRDVIASLLSHGDQVDGVLDYVRDEAEKRIPDAVRQKSWDDEMRVLAVDWLAKHPGLLEQQRNMPDWLAKDRRIKQILKDLEDKTVAADAKAAANDLFLEDLHAMPEVPVKWIVPDLILDEAVNGLFGDGATGKDLLLLMLGMSMTCGGKWLGREVKQGKVIYMPGEDPMAELKRREARISEYLKRQSTYDPVPQSMLIRPMIGEDPLLAVSDEKRTSIVKATPGYDNLRRVIDKFEPALVVVGNRVNIFAVNQNDDTLARQCLNYLHKLTQEFGCAIIMPAHPSLGSMSSGIGSSGSVQWNNGCRMRLYLSRIFEQDKTEPDPNLRTLEVKKVNWVAQGEIVTIEWRNGVFVPDQMTVEHQAEIAGKTPAEIERAEQEKHENEFLRLLDKHTAMGSHVNAAPTAHAYAPTIFSKDPDCSLKGKQGKATLRASMERLFDKKMIKSVSVGSPSRMRSHIERVGLKVVK